MEVEGIQISRGLHRAAKSGFLRQSYRIGEPAHPDVGEDKALRPCGESDFPRLGCGGVSEGVGLSGISGGTVCLVDKEVRV